MIKILIISLFVVLLIGNAYGQKNNTFPVPDEELLQIWNTRMDLQNAFPEVENGNLEKLKNWAKMGGWKTDSRLSALAPEGETTTYLTSATKQQSIMIYVIPMAVILAILTGFIFGYFKKHNGHEELNSEL